MTRLAFFRAAAIAANVVVTGGLVIVAGQDLFAAGRLLKRGSPISGFDTAWITTMFVMAFIGALLPLLFGDEGFKRTNDHLNKQADRDRAGQIHRHRIIPGAEQDHG